MTPRHMLVAIAFLISMLAALISLHYHEAFLQSGFFYYDSLSYIRQFLLHSNRIADVGRWQVFWEILANPSGLAIAVAVATHKAGTITSVPHLPQVVFWMTAYFYLILRIVGRSSSTFTGLLLALAIVPTLLVFGNYRSISDFWLESVAIWVYGCLLILLLESDWLRVRRVVIGIMVLLALLAGYRLSLILMSFPGFFGFVAVALIVLAVNARRGVYSRSQVHSTLINYGLLSMFCVAAMVFFYLLLHEGVEKKLASAYGWGTIADISAFVVRTFKNLIVPIETLWIAAAVVVALVILVSLLRAVRSPHLGRFLGLLVLIAGFWLMSVYILPVHYHSFDVVMLLQMHLVLIYGFLAIKDSKLAHRYLVYPLLLGFLVWSFYSIQEPARLQVENRIARTAPTRQVMDSVSELIQEHASATHIGFWYRENVAGLSTYYDLILRQRLKQHGIGYFSVHETYYTAREPNFEVQDWINENMELAGRRKTIALVFCPNQQIVFRRFGYTGVGLSGAIANALADALDESSDWQLIRPIEYNLGLNICAYKNF